MLGKWFKRTGKRDEIVLSSKFGIVMDFEKLEFKGIDSSAEYCKQECEASLKKLGVNCIDLCKFGAFAAAFLNIHTVFMLTSMRLCPSA
jgi:aryl-alcohol dehydrogenase-like predicted oxidoreductase